MRHFALKTQGFTLAELLIALGILGVIASFTIPKVLQSSQDTRWKSMAKEAASTLSSAYQAYQLDNTVTSETSIGDLTPYINYVSLSTTDIIDGWFETTTAPCTAAHPCLKLHNGGTIRYKDTPPSSGFGGTNTSNAVLFWFDPDGKVTDGTTNGPGKSVGFFLYYNGRMSEKGSILDPTQTEFSSYTPSTNNTPTWFSWD